MQTLGSRLLAARHASKLSRLDVARRTEVSPTALADYESDKHSPRVRVLAVLAELYGVAMASLVSEPPSCS